MPLEIELRFDVGPGDLARLARAPGFAGVTAARPAARRLSTVYYDTPDRGFAKAGLVLRMRKSGRFYIQTVKNETAGPLLDRRGEYEIRLASALPDLGAVPDAELRKRLQTIAGEEPVEPILETEIRRITRILTTSADEEIELALDRGEIRTLVNDRAIVPVCELELELKRGSPPALYEVAHILAHEVPLVVNPESKSARGLRAIAGDPPAARKAGRIDLAQDATAEDVFRASLSHCLRHIARNAHVVAESDDPEGVHQLRVGLRRLRVALVALGDLFRIGPFLSLHARAKTLADALAPQRELDVFTAELLAPPEDAAKKPSLAPLREALQDLRSEARAEAAALVRSEAFTGFILDLATAIETQTWREAAGPEQASAFLQPARALAAQALDRQMKKTGKRAKHLAKLDIAERHKLRIALKKLRYMAEFFAPLFEAKEAASFLGVLGKLQDLFGALNDAASAEHILERIAARAGPDASGLSEACAFVLGWHESRAPLTWDKAKKRWKRLAKTEPFWRS